MITKSRQRRFNQFHRLRASHTLSKTITNKIRTKKMVSLTSIKNKFTKMMLVITINMATKKMVK